MKIRTITSGIHLSSTKQLNKIKKIAEFNQNAKQFFEKEKYEVQTTRITTNPWPEYINSNSKANTIDEICKIEDICKEMQVSFFNIGYAENKKDIDMLSDINKNTSIISSSAKLGDVNNGINYKNIKASAKVIKDISRKTEKGSGNFRFAASANCPPGIPFFPAAYHNNKKSSFAIGLECGDLAMKAFSKSKNLLKAEKKLREVFISELRKVEKISKQISRKYQIEYNGIDASLNPSLLKSESIAFAYEKLGLGRFGQSGTLAISAMITKVLKNLSIKTCGFSGLMLPITEDYGLAKRADDEEYNITNLLLYSAVCGCGYDTIPLPGDITVKKIEAIILDMASLAIKLNKPLVARLFPYPGKTAGQKTNFKSPYLVDCKVLKV